MRLTSKVWLDAFRRHVESRSAFATIAKKGSDDAGAIFISIVNSTGTLDLLAPAPQAVLPDQELTSKNPFGDRIFERIKQDAPPQIISDYLERQCAFDSDFWHLEIESLNESENPLPLTILTF